MRVLILLALIVVLGHVNHVLSFSVTEEILHRPIRNKYDETIHLGSAGEQYVKEKGFPDMATMPSVVMIPGLGGSQLYATLNKTSGLWYCTKHAKNPYLIWMSITEMLPGEDECWAENINMQFNGTHVFNTSGVDIETLLWGSTITFEYVDPSFKEKTVYFADAVASLLAIGYARDVNLFGAPYDWRLSPTFNDYYFVKLQELIEKAYAVNNLPVVVFCHSMGNMYFHYFLQTVTQQWKDTYIKGFASVAPPWTGAAATFGSLLTGSNLGLPWLKPIVGRDLDRSYPSSYFLMPYPKYWSTEPVVVSPSVNYTVKDYSALFATMDDENAGLLYSVSQGIYDPIVAPGVNTIVYYGENVPTSQQFVYATNDWANTPTIINGNGDGTVNYESLTFGSNWVSNKSYETRSYPGQTHSGIITTCPQFTKDFFADFLY